MRGARHHMLAALPGLLWAFPHPLLLRVCAQPGGPERFGSGCAMLGLSPHPMCQRGAWHKVSTQAVSAGKGHVLATSRCRAPEAARVRDARLRLPAPALRGSRWVLPLTPSEFGLGQPSLGLEHGVFEHPPFAVKFLDPEAAQMDMSPLAPHRAHRLPSFHFLLSQV